MFAGTANGRAMRLSVEHTPEELLDIVDLQGEPTGEQLDKATIHQQGLWHRDVHVWITDGKNFLEQQRVWTKKIMPGAWDISASGHVPVGETYLDAAVRETEEEVGLRFGRDRFIPAGRLAVELAMEDGTWMHRTVGENFVVVAPDLRAEDLRLQESEVCGARLYPINQLEVDVQSPETAHLHAPQPHALWHLGIAAMRAVGA